jgi:hypothetical protein
MVATRPRYWAFAEKFIASAKQYFIPHDIVIFTDRAERFNVAHQIPHTPLGYPDATLLRYHAVMDQRALLSQYDSLFYSDSDMLFVNPASDEILSDGITATLHPGYYVNNRAGDPEHRPESTACLHGNQVYYCGGFNGGTSVAYLRMAETIMRNVDIDKSRGIVARWHDESHFQRYLADNPPAKVLTPAYCYPEGYGGGYGWSPDAFIPILLACEKGGVR